MFLAWRWPNLQPTIHLILLYFGGLWTVISLVLLIQFARFRSLTSKPSLAQTQEDGGPASGDSESETGFGEFLHTASASPLPRRLRINGIGYAVLFLYLALSLFFFLVSSSGSRPGGADRVFVVFVKFCIVVVAGFLLWKRYQHRRLLQRGTVTEDRIIWLREGFRDWNRVSYVFRNKNNQPVEGNGKDYSGILSVGSPVLAFYDPENSERNLAQGCSFYEVQLPLRVSRSAD